MRPSGVGVSKVMVALAPGAIGAMVELEGKHAVGEHPAGSVGYELQTLGAPDLEAVGLRAVVGQREGDLGSFCVAMMFFVPASSPPVEKKPVSSTAISMV